MIKPYFSGGLTMKPKTIWFLLGAAMILALAVTIIALGLSTGDSAQERKTRMDNNDVWPRTLVGTAARSAQPKSTQAPADFAADSQSPVRTPSVVINRVPPSDDQLSALEQRYRFRIPAGSYWYDNVSGAWGMEGGPTAGFTLPGLDLGGPLRADASHGNTGVFINGRELHHLDVLGLQQIVGRVIPGRYWVDSQGYCGYEGGPALLNLRQLAQAANQHPRGGGITSGMYDSGIGSVNGGGFISGSSSATRP
jgi:hypothetical protein